MHVPQILTETEAADLLGVSTAAVAAWARDGLLPVCARSEGGELLFYRWRVECDGPKLAASEVVRFRKANSRRNPATIMHDGRRLPCGCVLVQHGVAAGQPIWLCPDARAMQSIERLTAAFIAAAPNDPFFRRLARVTAEALARHLAPSKHPNAGTAAPGSVVPRSPPESSQTAREAPVT